MKYQELLAQTHDAITARKVFGEAHESDGVTVIPAARVAGGGGGGGGQSPEGEVGEGAGFGITGTPVGAFVVRDGSVTWQPAIDVNALVTSVAQVLVVAIVAFAWIRTRKPRTTV